MDKTIGNDVTIRPKAERGTGAFTPGDVIVGRYVVEKVLGEGGMGIVYQCLDKVGGVSVAVKCLPPEVSRNEDEMEDIRANYRLVSDLHHPNIAGARTLELDEATGDYYLVMDLAAGVTLKRWARRHSDAGLDAKLAILRQVAAAAVGTALRGTAALRNAAGAVPATASLVAASASAAPQDRANEERSKRCAALHSF